jgi:DNA mismatch endonuclease (patch repair protein)
MVFPKYQAVVMIHGCFWHGHDCKFFKLPSTRTEFWREKIEKNRLNDNKVLRALAASGWRVAVVWECAVRGKQVEGTAGPAYRLSEWLKSSSSALELPSP